MIFILELATICTKREGYKAVRPRAYLSVPIQGIRRTGPSGRRQAILDLGFWFSPSTDGASGGCVRLAIHAALSCQEQAIDNATDHWQDARFCRIGT